MLSLGRERLPPGQLFLIRPYRAVHVRVLIPTGILGLKLVLIR